MKMMLKNGNAPVRNLSQLRWLALHYPRPHQQEQPIVRVMITLIGRLGPADQFPFSGVSSWTVQAAVAAISLRRTRDEKDGGMASWIGPWPHVRFVLFQHEARARVNVNVSERGGSYGCG